MFRRLAGKENWLAVHKTCPVSPDLAPYRAVSAEHLIRALERLGYLAIRQKGSHVRLRHEGSPTHAITVPLHRPLKTGTLHGILAEVAQTWGDNNRIDHPAFVVGAYGAGSPGARKVQFEL